MDDLISRQAAIDALFDWEMTYDWDDHCREEDPKPAYIVSPSDVIERLPSAQPEIIQCRNCKFASGDSRICMQFGHSPIGELDFCAWAERRTDG